MSCRKSSALPSRKIYISNVSSLKSMMTCAHNLCVCGGGYANPSVYTGMNEYMYTHARRQKRDNLIVKMLVTQLGDHVCTRIHGVRDEPVARIFTKLSFLNYLYLPVRISATGQSEMSPMRVTSPPLTCSIIFCRILVYTKCHNIYIHTHTHTHKHTGTCTGTVTGTDNTHAHTWGSFPPEDGPRQRPRFSIFGCSETGSFSGGSGQQMARLHVIVCVSQEYA